MTASNIFSSPKPNFATWWPAISFWSTLGFTAIPMAPPANGSENRLGSGQDVLLDIDVQGARQIMEQVPDALTILILPPSRKELERRLTDRGQDRPEVIRRRMEGAAEEVGAYRQYRYAIINDSLEDALLELKSVVGSPGTDPGGTVRNRWRIQEVIRTFKEAR